MGGWGDVEARWHGRGGGGGAGGERVYMNVPVYKYIYARLWGEGRTEEGRGGGGRGT